MSDFLQKAWSVAKSPWALLALAVAGAIVLALRLNAGRTELAELRAEKERATLRADDFLVAKQEIEGQVKALLGANAAMAAEVDRLKKVSPGTRVVYVARAATRPAPASGAPRGAEGAPVAGVGAGTPPVCLLAQGDLGAVQVQEVALETRAGNRVIVGEAWAWRTQPGRARLFGGPWAAELSEAAAEPPPAATGGRGWGGGAWASAGSGGAVAGPAVAFPPLWGLEATAGAGLGRDGAWAAGVSVVWRPGR